MFGNAYFGPRYFGDRYFGQGIGEAVPEAVRSARPEGPSGGARRKRRYKFPNPFDDPSLREIEEVYHGKKSEPLPEKPPDSGTIERPPRPAKAPEKVAPAAVVAKPIAIEAPKQKPLPEVNEIAELRSEVAALRAEVAELRQERAQLYDEEDEERFIKRWFLDS